MDNAQSPQPEANTSFKIWVDADGCPNAVKEIIYRAALRCKLHVTLVANRVLSTPNSVWVNSIVVSSGLDVADDWIVEQVSEHDLVITSDIPLAARVVARGATGLNPRGELYTEANVRERLSLRDFMHELREQGVQTGGASSFGARDKQRFASALDRILTQRINQLKAAAST